MRILYATRRWTGHDDRFVAAWREAAIRVDAFALDGSAPGRLHGVTDVRAALDGEIDLVHAGPLTDVAWQVAQAWDGAMLAASWGFDLMDEAPRDPVLRDRAAAAVERAEVVMVDNDVVALRAVDLGAAPERIFQLPWGIDVAYFSPGPASLRDRLGWSDDDVVVASTRRLEPLYQVRLALDAFIDAAPSSDRLRLVIGGGGSLLDGLRRRADSAGLGDRIAFLGEIGPSEMRDVYRSAELYVSTSPIDGTSVSMLEAMACGTPVCVTDIPQNLQWVGDGRGATFRTGDAQSLSRALSTLATEGEEAHAHRAAAAMHARRTVHERANWANAPAVLRAEATSALERRDGARP